MMGFAWRCCRFCFSGAVRVLKVFFRGLGKFYGLRRNTVKSKWASVGRRLEGEREREKKDLPEFMPASINCHH